MSYAGFDLNAKVALVIGGTSGIGRALARGLILGGKPDLYEYAVAVGFVSNGMAKP